MRLACLRIAWWFVRLANRLSDKDWQCYILEIGAGVTAFTYDSGDDEDLLQRMNEQDEAPLTYNLYGDDDLQNDAPEM